MQIDFTIDAIPVRFRRNCFTGRMVLETSEQVIELQSSLSLGTHFSTALTRSWQQVLAEKKVVIEKTRPLVFAGFRPQAYRILVNDELVASVSGY